MKKLPVLFFLLSIILIVLTSCGGSSVVDEIDNANTQFDIYAKNQPQEIYDFSVERAVLQAIIDARVKNSNTYTYFFGPFGNRPIFSCASRGYPISATAQATNPEQPFWWRDTLQEFTLSQIEPTGIYAPPNTDATFSACLLSNGNVSPFYWEPGVVSSPVPLQWVPDEYGGHLEVASSDQIPSVLDEKLATVQFNLEQIQKEAELRSRK